MAENQTTQTSENVQSEMNKLKADFARLSSDMRDALHTLKGEGRQRARHAQADVSARMEDGYARAQQYVEEQPIKTLCIAFAVGFIFAKLFRR